MDTTINECYNHLAKEIYCLSHFLQRPIVDHREMHEGRISLILGTIVHGDPIIHTIFITTKLYNRVEHIKLLLVIECGQITSFGFNQIPYPP